MLEEEDEERAFIVDEVFGNQKIVIRDLEYNCLSSTELFTSTAMMGDGSAVMVLDLPQIMKNTANRRKEVIPA